LSDWLKADRVALQCKAKAQTTRGIASGEAHVADPSRPSSKKADGGDFGARKVETPRHFEAQGAGCGVWRFEPDPRL